jgi:hypothetical protein
MTKQHSNYSDLITFTRASAGHALRPVSYGSEEITNGSFDTDSGWVKSTTPATTISSGEATVGGTGGNGYIYQDAGLTVGTLYQISFDVTSAHSSSLTFLKGSDFGSSSGSYKALGLLTTGAHAVNFVATSEFIGLTVGGGNDAVIVIDNVSVKEVSFDESDGTLTLFEHPDNIPRVEYDADGNRLGLLVEESRTNQVQYSTPDSNWNTSTLGTGVTPVVTLNNETSPDGTTSAAKVVLDVGGGTTSGDRSLFLVPSASVTATNSYAGSVWLKGETGGEQVVMRHAGNATYSLFTLTTSWARYDVTETAAGSSATMAIGLKGNQSDATATIYVWGAQIEEGSFPTSTIVNNSGSTATRSADVASIPVADFGFNADEGSVVVEAQHFTTATTAHAAFGLDDGTASNRLYYYQNKGQWIGSVSGTTTMNIDGADPAENTLTKTGVAYKSDDYAHIRNGSNIGFDTTSPGVPVVTTLGIGQSSVGTRLNGHIKSIKYYPRRLTNAQLQDLTS